MSNHSEQEYQAAADAAAQSIASTTTDPWWVMACIRACEGDHVAGLMLSQLLYWWPRKRPGQKGVKKSVSDWQAELMLGRKPVERINKLLMHLGLVTIYLAPWGRLKSDSTHYVLTDKALALLKAHAPTGLRVDRPLDPKVQVTENTFKPSENTTSKTDSPGQPVADQETPEHEGKSSGEQGKAEPKPTSTPTASSTFPDAVEKAPKIIGWPCRWLSRWEATADAAGDYHRGRFVMLATQFEARHRPFTPFLEWLLQRNKLGVCMNWKHACENTKHKAAKSDAINPKNATPNIDYLIRNGEAMYEFYEQTALGKTPKASRWIALSKPISAPVTVQKGPHTPSSITLAALKFKESLAA
jgi:hypothetical protein